MKKKVVTMLLAIVLSSTGVISCGETKETPTTVEEGKESDKETTDKQPEESEEVNYDSLPFQWSKTDLAKHIPVAVTDNIVETLYDDEEVYEIKVSGDKESFDKYVELLKKAGYIHTTNDSEDFYRAYRENDCYIARVSLEEDGTYGIRVDLSPIANDLLWPEIGIATHLPKIENKKGKVEYESEDYLQVFVECNSKKEFNDYATACYDKGFTVDYQKSDSYYYGKSKDGYSVTLSYRDYGLIMVEGFAVNAE